MRKIRLLGLNHTTAALDVRERMAFPPVKQVEALRTLRQRKPDGEFVLISTCNRVELVHAAEEPWDDARLVAELAAMRGADPAALTQSVYQLAGRAATEHLFRVSAGMGSMVVGETQILGQVKAAYATAQAEGTIGKRLHPLFQRALQVGKQVLHETALGEGRVSIASVAVDYARQIFGDFGKQTVLVVGAGKMARLVARSFVDQKPKRMLLCNRSADRAESLRQAHGGETVPWENLEQALVEADVAAFGTGADTAVLTVDMLEPLMSRRRYRPMFLIDVAVPRNVEVACGELESVYRYDVDDLQRVVSRTTAGRQEALADAEAIVARHVEQFTVWNRQRELGPTIAALYKKQHDRSKLELDALLATMPDLDETQRARLEDFRRKLVNKLMHDPVKALRRRGEGHAYQHALAELFNLDNE
ncbi:MAG: glutamyl-tRNA reductase [Planctomycetota bacterium]